MSPFGFEGDIDTSGTIGMPSLTTGEIFGPVSAAISEDGQWVQWDDTAGAYPERRSSVGYLDAFLKIGRAKNPGLAALRLIQRYGPLNLCQEHGLPRNHLLGGHEANDPLSWYLARGRPLFERSSAPAECSVPVSPDSRAAEDVVALAVLSNVAQAILDGFQQLRRGRPVEQRTMRVLFGDEWRSERPLSEDARLARQLASAAMRQAGLLPDKSWEQLAPITRLQGIQRRRLLRIMTIWASWAWMRPNVVWEFGQRNPSFAIEVDNFGSLTAQMMLVIAGGKSWLTCSSCGMGYPPKRRPHTGQPNYCDKAECKKRGRALSQQDRRNRQKTQSAQENSQ